MTLVSKDISNAIEILQRDQLVAIPTETVYGLAGNIFSETAIKRIFEMKKRPMFNPLIVHVASLEQLNEIVSHVPEKAKLLAEAFWPGPLTLILPKQNHIPNLVTAGKDTVGVRVPRHPIALELLKQLNFPLAAPSANPFGNISPTSSKHVKNYFEGVLEMVLEGGECKSGIESTIVGFENEEPVVYRLGSTSLEDIESIVGKVSIQNKKETAPNAPGMLSRHYAPETHTFLVDDAADFIKQYPEKKIGILSFDIEVIAPQIVEQKILSLKGDLEEATSQLYAALHELDSLELDMIVAQRFPDYGLGKSINDRLQRATKRK